MKMILYKKRKAFTLVELLIVLAVIAILFIVYISKVGFVTDKAKLVGVQTDFRSYYLATKAVQIECNPEDINDVVKFESALNKSLDKSLVFTSGISNAVDPWGYHYQYTYDITDNNISVMFIAKTDGSQTICYSMGDFSKSLSSNPLKGMITYGTQITSDGLSDIPSDVKDKLSNEIKDTEKVELESIEVTNLPTKVGYIEGEDFDPTGMVITATYSDHSSRDITEYTLNNINDLKFDQTTVQVKYEDKSVDVPITVTNKSISKIEVIAQPTKTSYIEGEDFDSTGMVIRVTYDNGKSEEVTDYVVQNGTSLTVDQTTVKVVYGDKDVTVPITVTAKQLISISITTPPIKTSYIEGEGFDPAGMVVTATYNNGKSESVTGYTMKDSSNLGKTQTTVTVVYGSKEATVPITVTAKQLVSISITTPPIKTSFIEGENFDPAGMVVTATYNNGKSESVTGYTMKDSSNLGKGQTTVTVVYESKEATVPITVTAKQLVSIAVATQPTKKVYTAGENFDPTGMIIIANYNNGSSVSLSSGYVLSNNTNLSSTSQSIGISFTDTGVTKTCSLFVEVNAPSPATLAASTGWYKSYTVRSYFNSIQMLDSYSPTGAETESWNADVGNSGSIKCYIVGTNLIIAGNGSGKIRANADSSSLFYGTSSDCFKSVVSITGLNILDTSNVTTMNSMFCGCNSLKSVDVNNFNTCNVTNMKNMFYGTKALTSLNLSSFNTSKVTDMSNMFCYIGASSLNLSTFNTTSLTNISGMFYARSAITLDLRNWNTSNITNKFCALDSSSTGNITIYVSNSSVQSLLTSGIAYNKGSYVHFVIG